MVQKKAYGVYYIIYIGKTWGGRISRDRMKEKGLFFNQSAKKGFINFKISANEYPFIHIKAI